MIISDSREQLPLPFERYIRKKLHVGDYTTQALEGKYHIERKSPADFYGSLIQGHERFKKEFLRAIASNIEIDVYVECSQLTFLNKQFPRGDKLKCSSVQLAKMIDTMKEKYKFKVVYCNNREEMMQLMERKFYLKEIEFGVYNS